MCFDCLFTLVCVAVCSVREVLSYIYGRLYIKRPLLFSDLNQNLNFLDRFWKTLLDVSLHKTLSTEGRVVPSRQTDGRTDRHDDVNSRFRQSEKPAVTYLSHKSPASPISIRHAIKVALQCSCMQQHRSFICVIARNEGASTFAS